MILMIGPLPPKYGGSTVSFKLSLEFIDKLDLPHRIVDTNNKRTIPALLEILSTLSKTNISKIFFNASNKRAVYQGAVLLFVSRTLRIPFNIRIFGGNVNVFAEGRVTRKMLFLYLLKYSNSVFLQTRVLVDNYAKFKSVVWQPNSRPLPPHAESLVLNISTIPQLYYLGKISSEKGIQKMLGELDHLSKNFKFDLHLAGDVESNINLEKYDFVHYHGIIAEREKIITFLKDKEVLIFPSFWEGEGYSGTVIEALSMKKLVLVNKHNSLQEMTTINGNRLAIDFDIHEDYNLSETLKNIICNNTDLDIIRRNVDHYYNFYDSNKWNEKMFNKIILE